MDTVRVTIPTHYGLLFGVACVGEADVWVYGNNQNIARFDIHGTANANVSAECNPWSGSISVTVHGNLIYSDTKTGTVKIFRHRNAEIFLTPPDGWTPLGLCCPTSGDILVQVYKNIDTQLRNKIIRYRGQNIVQEYETDEEGNRLLSDGMSPLYISENGNGDVCVSDNNANRVVAVARSGRVRFRYNGTPALRINPKGIVTDVANQIIVTDVNNHCLHILDQDGHFLRPVENLGIENPVGLSIDANGRLWVGLSQRREIKVIEYFQNQ